MYDAAVVGARCAGSPTAMLLARKGYEVLLLDRVMAMYDFTYQMATLTPPTPEFRSFVATLSRNPKEIEQFLRTFGGTVSIPEFFSPENMQRIVAESRVGGATRA